jgi:hypothetical protein
MAYSLYTPSNIIAKERHQRIALFLVILFTPILLLKFAVGVYATESYSWNVSNFSQGGHAAVVSDTAGIRLTLMASSSDSAFNDFYKGDINHRLGFHRTAITNEGVSLSQGFSYTSNEGPVLAGGAGRDFLQEGNIIYSCSWKGLTAIDTKGTFSDPVDDTVVGRYSTTTSPGILDGGNISSCFKSGNIFYLSDAVNGFYIFDTKGTLSFSDDTVSRFYTGLMASFLSDGVYNIFVQGNTVYAATNAGLYVFDTHGSINAGDYTLLARYYTGSLPALLTNYTYDVYATSTLIYISTGSGTSVVDTAGTATTTDDVLLGTYNKAAFPTIPNANVYTTKVVVSGDLVYIVSRISVMVFDTKGTKTLSDDEYLGDYASGTIANNIILDGDKVDLTNFSGQSIVDTKGTKTLSDDTILNTFKIDSNPFVDESFGLYPFASYYAAPVYYDGLMIITPGNYLRQGSYMSFPRDIASVPTTSLRTFAAVGAGQAVQLSYRTASSGAVWRDDFATTSSFVGDFYGWGYGFASATTSGGVLHLQGHVSGQSEEVGWIDTGKPDNYFKAHSVITARVRVNNTDQSKHLMLWMVTDDWWTETMAQPTTDWQILKIAVDNADAFSKIGFDLYDENNTNIADASVDIDWIEVTPADSMGQWSPWHVCAEASHCILPNFGSDKWLQYKLDLSTASPATTPLVSKVTYQGKFAASGIYTSKLESFPGLKDLGTFTADADVPTGTSLSYEYSLDEGVTWNPIASGDTFTLGKNITTSLLWRAHINSSDGISTPVIRNVTITASPHVSTKTTSTSLSTQMAQLQANGDTAAVAQLRTEYPQYFNGTASKFEIQVKIVELLQQVVTHFAELLQWK